MISIIIPVFNAEKYLQECIESILRQKYSEFEIILIDDGSRDKSPIICDKYAQQDQRIKVIHKENGGVSSARNYGLKICHGEWVVFADADDYFTDTAFDSFYEASKSSNDLILFNAIKIKGNYSKIMFQYNNEKKKSLYQVTNRAVWAHLFRKSIISENNIKFPENLAYSEDTIFLYRFMLHCKNIWQSNKIVYVYRINESSACASTNGLRIACNQFMAAKEFKNILSDFSSLHELKPIIAREINILLRMGFFSYTSNIINKESYGLLKKCYKESLGNNFKYRYLFYYHFLIQYMRVQRKKIIRIHKI